MNRRSLAITLTLPLLAALLSACGPTKPKSLVTRSTSPDLATLAATILVDPSIPAVINTAEATVDGALNAGSNYGTVWIRDLATFSEFYIRTGGDQAALKAALLNFAALQGPDGGVPDDYLGTTAVHKSGVESDQESSFVQAVTIFVDQTHDTALLGQQVNSESVLDHLERALEYVWSVKLSSQYGLVWNGITVDWGDVPAYTTDTNAMPTSPDQQAVDIYANAMYSLAIQDFLSLPGVTSTQSAEWTARLSTLDGSIQSELWDPVAQKYKAHLYLGQSPFPSSFDESQVFVMGGTTVAIQAGLLSDDQIQASLDHMNADMQAAHAATIGVDVYPTYPGDAFPCCQSGDYSMQPYHYQNGGDWDWFGARMVQDLIHHGMYEQAYEAIEPMLARVVQNGGIYEWWTPSDQPEGSANFRGGAGELGLAALELLNWARSQQPHSTVPMPPTGEAKKA